MQKALRLVQNTIDGVIDGAAAGNIELPKLIITAEKAVEAAGFENPYAKAKAIAAYEMAGAVANLDMKGCFMKLHPISSSSTRNGSICSSIS